MYNDSNQKKFSETKGENLFDISSILELSLVYD